MWSPDETPGQISCQSLAIDFTLHRVGHVTSASRQRQSSHVSHENVTQNPNPFQHYSQRLGNFTSLASASPTLSMLTRPNCPPDETPSLPPHLLTLSHPLPYHSYAC
ncbi:hypothetical protein O181_108666, partial [Austropuccinia psidii MF-1]|nr:hypothetical protein [Austropuccinia psidii MF-1]